MQRTALIVFAAFTFACAPKIVPVKTVVVTPPPPPPQDPPALVVAQNVLELPEPQPIPPGAVPPRPALEPVAVAADPSSARPVPPRRAASREAEAPEPAQETPAPAAPKTTNSLAPLVSADPNLPTRDTIRKRIARVDAMLARLVARRGKAMPEDLQMLQKRIQFFLDQARHSLANNDLREADSLSSRALVLAEDLLGVR